MPSPPLKKALGQHFLTRPEVCAPLVEFLAPAGRRVLEIGPGSGALTKALLVAGAEVVAWELDASWAAEVEQRLAGPNLSVVVGDATEIDWSRLPAGMLVAGNLPYNVATAIVLACLEANLDDDGGTERAAFLLQLEVADRLAAGPGDSSYGSLSVLVAALARTELLGHVAPGAFRPPPKVDSAFVGLTRRPAVDRREYDELKPFVRAAFAHRRKTLRNSLAPSLGIETASRLVESCGLASDTRAERLDLDSFRRLLTRLREIRSSDTGENPL